MSETVFGVWHAFWDENELIALYRTREAAERKAKSGGVYTSVDYAGVEKWHVEEHVLEDE